MLTFYVDETGFTGEDLLADDQPIFVQSTNNFSRSESEALLRESFHGIEAKELKHSRLIRNPKNYKRIVDLVGRTAADPSRAGMWCAHKEFALVTMIVDWWIEPLAYRSGFNLYNDGANICMSNMIFVCLEAFFGRPFRRKLLLSFQRMLRARTQETYEKCQIFVTKELSKLEEDRAEVLRYLWPSFELLGLQHVEGLPKRVLDLALPGLVLIGNRWRERHSGPWELVHDRSSNMAKQKWLWDALSSPEIPMAEFAHPGGNISFPMNIMSTRFSDSAVEPQLQICDLLAGAAGAYLRQETSSGDRIAYREALDEVGIKRLFLGGIWPNAEVTPEELGTKGWDGNVAIEWIGEQIAAKRGLGNA